MSGPSFLAPEEELSLKGLLEEWVPWLGDVIREITGRKGDFKLS